MESDLSSLIEANDSQMGTGSYKYSELDNVDKSIEMSQDSDDKELQDNQIAAHRMAQLTGPPLSSVCNLNVLKRKYIAVLHVKTTPHVIF